MSHSRFNSPRLALSLVAAILLAPAPLAQDFSHPDTAPAPQNALIQKANEALDAGDFPAALKILTTLNTQTPNNPQVLYDLGLTLEALTSTEPAAATPAATGPDSAAPNQTVSTAESCYRKSIDANPLFPAAHVALGLLLARSNRPAEARPELLAATTLPDADPVLKARAFRALARLDQQSAPPHPAPPSAPPPAPRRKGRPALPGPPRGRRKPPGHSRPPPHPSRRTFPRRRRNPSNRS